ncbi:hypothetical protein ABZ897_28385 [Nonomuraea sp. NPDC046802]|uniref:hypothetical protein n=1 Tax=Nonomuraea sp. NPDC046802 TaxID=3154919 RepID=UPI0033CBD204
MTAPSVYDTHDRRLKELISEVIAAQVPAVVVDQATAERSLLRLAGALLGISQRHRADERGRCRLCRHVLLRGWPWRARWACTVQPTLAHYLRDADPLRFSPPEGGGSS